jgi:hypothetical protein
MSDDVAACAGRAGARWEAIDPLLPQPAVLDRGCGAELITAGAPGQPPAAAGCCAHWSAAPESLDSTWGAARQFRLTARVAGPDVGGALDDLLSRWRDHLGTVPGAGDIDAVTALGLETIRFDALFGGVVERPHTAAALRREVAAALEPPEPWVWLAERDGTAAGMAWVEPPGAAGWIAPMTGRAPVAYVSLAGVTAGRRGGGAGRALAAQAHREIAAAGVAVTLLHYAVPHPLSVPFWSARGYRPPWTAWEARPAAALR